MLEILQRESIYIWYYFVIQFNQIALYYILGIILGAFVSIFVKDKVLTYALAKIQAENKTVPMIMFSSIVGIISPLCMYGTIPIASSFAQKGVKEHFIASFMLSSILLNPQLIVYSLALGKTVFIIRIISCFVCGILSGILVYIFYSNRNKAFFNFSLFENNNTIHREASLLEFGKSIIRNIEHTGLYFLIGILLSALFQRYVNQEAFASIFGATGNKGFGVLMAATIGVPIYACGGATIALLMSWLEVGMTLGAAASFMITGPSTKITNISALKMVLGGKHLILYFLYIFIFSLLTGFLTN